MYKEKMEAYLKELTMWNQVMNNAVNMPDSLRKEIARMEYLLDCIKDAMKDDKKN